MNKEQHTSNSTLATEVIAQLKNELFKLETETGEGTNKLLMAERALLMLKDKYEWGFVPSVDAAYKAMHTVSAEKKCTENEYRSWEYMVGYEEIMFFVNVALDYCIGARQLIENKEV